MYFPFALVVLFGMFSIVAEAGQQPSPSDNLRFYGLELGAAMNARIFRFQSTMIIPAGSPESNTNAIQYLWPGMEAYQRNNVFQNVIANGAPGEWYLEPYYCCKYDMPKRKLWDPNVDKIFSPVAMLVPGMKVYPGDSLTNTFTLNPLTMKWHNNWINIPGPAGTAAGEAAFSGGLVFDPKDYDDDNTTAGEIYTSAIFAIELQRAGQWDFGNLSWRDIILEIDTKDTTWCTNGPHLNNEAPFKFNFSPPVASVVDNVVRCYIAEMNFVSP
ncbi:uncharacterized protein PAC_06016 [Phialocephala subalpina]|uniref:Uncharacterized protein n=1 Tax=Phialocephala subalpina TaxID=576137 RepID=A0A1L7WTN1_9HELO|nr:uncharacterized protein PAC_06016 [Phialocephala subalpina]